MILCLKQIFILKRNYFHAILINIFKPLIDDHTPCSSECISIDLLREDAEKVPPLVVRPLREGLKTGPKELF